MICVFVFSSRLPLPHVSVSYFLIIKDLFTFFAPSVCLLPSGPKAFSEAGHNSFTRETTTFRSNGACEISTTRHGHTTADSRAVVHLRSELWVCERATKFNIQHLRLLGTFPVHRGVTRVPIPVTIGKTSAVWKGQCGPWWWEPLAQTPSRPFKCHLSRRSKLDELSSDSVSLIVQMVTSLAMCGENLVLRPLQDSFEMSLDLKLKVRALTNWGECL